MTNCVKTIKVDTATATYDIARLIQTVADKFLFSLPGFRSLMWAFQVPYFNKLRCDESA